MSVVRLAWSHSGKNVESGLTPMLQRPESERPAMLVSYVVLREFQQARSKYGFRDWVLDSGAFSAHNSGSEIKLIDFIGTAKDLLQTDPKLTEVFSLDVIGDWKASLRNTEAMHKAGVPAIPCFHAGEPWDLLCGMARDFPKVALGGVARMNKQKKIAWAQQCFARAWPCKFHGFGFGAEAHIMALPWHSVDASSWQFGPQAFGRWNAFGRMEVRGANINLRPEVEFYLKVEKRAKFRWRHELKMLEEREATRAKTKEKQII